MSELGSCSKFGTPHKYFNSPPNALVSATGNSSGLLKHTLGTSGLS